MIPTLHTAEWHSLLGGLNEHFTQKNQCKY